MYSITTAVAFVLLCSQTTNSVVKRDLWNTLTVAWFFCFYIFSRRVEAVDRVMPWNEAVKCFHKGAYFGCWVEGPGAHLVLRGSAVRTNFLTSVTFTAYDVHLYNLPWSWLQMLCLHRATGLHHGWRWNMLMPSVRYRPEMLLLSTLLLRSYLTVFVVHHIWCVVLYFFMLIEHNMLLVFKINDLGAKLWGSSQAKTAN